MTHQSAIILALGQPSDPLPHDKTMREMADAVAGHLPGWTIRGATLESPGSLAAAAEGLASPFVYPLFLAQGYFMMQVLPRRLQRLVPGAVLLPHFGADPALPGLAADVAMEAARAHGYEVKQTSLLLAAHGSERVPASRMATESLASLIASRGGFARVVCGYLEEHPFIDESARGLGQAICLPLFALRASHVAVDVPAALARASFAGPVLDPLGMHPAVPRLIGNALGPLEAERAA